MARTSAGPGPVASVPERLLAVATRLFAEKGFEGASVQEIVDAAGVTKGAMYHYFDSKDDLLYEIYHRLLATQTKRLEQIAGGRGTADKRVHAAAAGVIGISFAHMDELIVFFRSMHMLPRDKQMAVRAQRRRYHERFRALVEEGQGAGLFKRGLPADLVVRFFFGGPRDLHVVPLRRPVERPGGGWLLRRSAPRWPAGVIASTAASLLRATSRAAGRRASGRVDAGGAEAGRLETGALEGWP